jgi:hypothetical protein
MSDIIYKHMKISDYNGELSDELNRMQIGQADMAEIQRQA